MCSLFSAAVHTGKQNRLLALIELISNAVLLAFAEEQLTADWAEQSLLL